MQQNSSPWLRFGCLPGRKKHKTKTKMARYRQDGDTKTSQRIKQSLWNLSINVSFGCLKKTKGIIWWTNSIINVQLSRETLALEVMPCVYSRFHKHPLDFSSTYHKLMLYEQRARVWAPTKRRNKLE